MNREKRERMKKERESTSDPYLTGADVRPPAAPEIEADVLGSLMIEKEAAYKVNFDDLPKLMYLKAHKLIAEAMGELFKEGTPIDTVTLYERLKKKGELEEAGGAIYLSKLSQNIPSAANIEYHFKIIYEKAILRNIITSAHEMAKNAYESTSDAFEIVEQAHKSLDALMPEKIQPLKGQEFLNDRADKEFKALLERKGKPSVSLGYSEFDVMTHGAQPGELTIIAARPGQGKTTVALNIAKKVAEQEFYAAYFSLETKDNGIRQKLWANRAGIDSAVFRMHNTPLSKEEVEKINEAKKYVANLPLYIDDDNPNIGDLIYKVGVLKRKHPNLALVIIDNLQGFISWEAYKKKEDMVKEIILAAKYDIAKGNNVHTMLLGQLELSVEDIRKNPEAFPYHTSDMQDVAKGTNLIETADNIIFLYRPEEYFPDKKNQPSKLDIYQPIEGKILIKDMKFRMGEKASKAFVMGFNKYLSRLSSIEKE